MPVVAWCSDRGLEQFDLVDVRSFSKDGTERAVYGYRAIGYAIPPGMTTALVLAVLAIKAIMDVFSPSHRR